MTLSELLGVVYRYHPRGRYVGTPGYNETEEHRRLVDAIGFDGGFFNVELRVPEDGPARIIEINARIASQFAPLVEALHGRSTYDALFALACGDDPAWESRRPDGFAISYVLRVFDDAFVEAVPEPENGLELLVRPGRRLSEQGVNDAASYRLAIFTETGYFAASKPNEPAMPQQPFGMV